MRKKMTVIQFVTLLLFSTNVFAAGQNANVGGNYPFPADAFLKGTFSLSIVGSVGTVQIKNINFNTTGLAPGNNVRINMYLVPNSFLTTLASVNSIQSDVVGSSCFVPLTSFAANLNRGMNIKCIDYRKAVTPVASVSYTNGDATANLLNFDIPDTYL